MNRWDLQELSKLRIAESRTLFETGHHSGAYHLAGLAVECALKACIARSTRRFDFPDKKFAAEVYDHDLTKLRKLAGLEAKFTAAVQRLPALAINWSIVKDWKIESRYEKKTRQEAEDLLSAAQRPKTGVIRWIRDFW